MTVAVSVEALRPKEIPLLSANVRADNRFDVVPPEIRIFVRLEAIEPVMVDPLSPKLTALELLKTTLARLLEVVPAEKLTGEGAPAGAAAVIFPSAESPKLTPPPLPKAPEISLPEAFSV